MADDEVTRLRAALEDALEGLQEMITYMDPYFRIKWAHDEYIDRAKAALKEHSSETPELHVILTITVYDNGRIKVWSSEKRPVVHIVRGLREVADGLERGAIGVRWGRAEL